METSNIKPKSRFLKVEDGRAKIAASTEVKTVNVASRKHVLVVDDDVELCQLLTQFLAREGFEVECVNSGALGFERAVSGSYSIVVLDVMLPDIKGFEVLRRVRAESRVPVLMLTARGDDQDRILGLEMGADDYLPKPFNPRELCARIDAVLRRAWLDSQNLGPIPEERVFLEDIEIDKGSRSARRAGKSLDLTSVEFDLLELFLKSAGSVLSREEMVRLVLGRDFSPFDRSMDTHVSNLRRKLGPRPDGTERIKGVRGIGYLYVLPSE
ncbi:MAG: response regulator transcription factor [Candidatus Acidiferrales bacterium]